MCFCFYEGTTFYCNTRWFRFFFSILKDEEKIITKFSEEFPFSNCKYFSDNNGSGNAGGKWTLYSEGIIFHMSIVPRRRLTENDDRNYRNLVLTMGFFMYRWVYDSADNLKTARNHALYTYQLLFLVIFISAWRKSMGLWFKRHVLRGTSSFVDSWGSSQTPGDICLVVSI